MAIYICSKCLFCFERTSEVNICPDCACMSVRFATDEETAEYMRNKAEFKNDAKDEPEQVEVY